MKSFFVLILCLITSAVYCQLHPDNTIEVKYVSSILRPAYVITPKIFDSAFAYSMYKDTVFTNNEMFAKLWNSYKEVTYGKDPKVIDIRYKVTLYFSVYNPPLVIYMNSFFDTFDDKGLIVKGTFLKTLHHMVDAIVYKKKL